jgi:hypothetical protein
MTVTPISLLQEAGQRGLFLKAVGDKLHVFPHNRCPPEFADKLRAHKRHLLVLLRLQFLVLRSATLGETIFFAEDEDTRAALVEAGAEPGCIYTREELRFLVEQHRREPITAGELLHIHGARRAFDGRLTR